MKKRYYLGIDLAKLSFEFCLLRGNRSCLWRGKFNNEPTQIERFLEQLSARVHYKLLSVHFAMEATGVYGKRLVAALHQRQLTVSVLNPAQVKFFALSVLRRTKNDPVDAGVIARFCLERKPLATRPLRWVEEQLIACQRRDRLAQLQHQLAQLDAAINSLIHSDQFFKAHSQLLCSIPGIAQLTAAKLLSELAGKEFGSARQLAAYVGLTPSQYLSGGSLYGKTRLCKIGNAFLRKALFMPAAVARRWCKPLRRWALILETRKLPALAIRAALMRKLLHIAFGVLKHQQPFNPDLVFIPKTS